MRRTRWYATCGNRRAQRAPSTAAPPLARSCARRPQRCGRVGTTMALTARVHRRELSQAAANSNAGPHRQSPTRGHRCSGSCAPQPDSRFKDRSTGARPSESPDEPLPYSGWYNTAARGTWSRQKQSGDAVQHLTGQNEAPPAVPVPVPAVATPPIMRRRRPIGRHRSFRERPKKGGQVPPGQVVLRHEGADEQPGRCAFACVGRGQSRQDSGKPGLLGRRQRQKPGNGMIGVFCHGRLQPPSGRPNCSGTTPRAALHEPAVLQVCAECCTATVALDEFGEPPPHLSPQPLLRRTSTSVQDLARHDASRISTIFRASHLY